MEITKELVEKVKHINFVLEVASVAISPNGDMYKIQSVDTIEQKYDMKKFCLETAITQEFNRQDKQCGIYIESYWECDKDFEDEFVSAVDLAEQGWKLQGLVTIYPATV